MSRASVRQGAQQSSGWTPRILWVIRSVRPVKVALKQRHKLRIGHLGGGIATSIRACSTARQVVRWLGDREEPPRIYSAGLMNVSRAARTEAVTVVHRTSTAIDRHLSDPR